MTLSVICKILPALCLWQLFSTHSLSWVSVISSLEQTETHWVAINNRRYPSSIDALYHAEVIFTPGSIFFSAICFSMMFRSLSISMKFFVDTDFRRGASMPATMFGRTVARASVGGDMAVRSRPQALPIATITVAICGLNYCLLFHLRNMYFRLIVGMETKMLKVTTGFVILNFFQGDCLYCGPLRY